MAWYWYIMIMIITIVLTITIVIVNNNAHMSSSEHSLRYRQMQDGQAGRILEINELLGAAVVRGWKPLFGSQRCRNLPMKPCQNGQLEAGWCHAVAFSTSPPVFPTYLALDPSCVSPSCLLQDSNMLMHPMGLNYFLKPTPTNPN